MKSIIVLIQELKNSTEKLRPPLTVARVGAMTFRSTFGVGEPIEGILPIDAAGAYPKDILEFWTQARTATLFEDQTFGQ